MRADPRRALVLTAPLALLLIVGLGAGPQSNDKCCAPKAASAVEKASDYTGTSNRHFVTVRGEIVDYYCYIEKGLTGAGHKDCGTRCVAGDVCMGILTTD